MMAKVVIIGISFLLSVSLGEAFNCFTSGMFPNDYDPTCRTYYVCKNEGLQISSTFYKCPKTFDPSTRQCSDTYLCKKETFVCTSSGYYPDLSDVRCVSYYNCFNLFGFLFKLPYSCAAGHQFDPTKRLCSPTYKCDNYLLAPEEPKVTEPPETTEEVKTTDAIETTETTKTAEAIETSGVAKAAEDESTIQNANVIEEAKPSEDTKITEETKVTEPPETTEITKVTEAPVTEADTEEKTATVEEFVCTEKGMFPDKLDKSCSSYFYCIPSSDGQFVKKVYKCPVYFNPQTKQCTNTYNCQHDQTTIDDVVSSTETTNETTGQTTEQIMDDESVESFTEQKTTITVATLSTTELNTTITTDRTTIPTIPNEFICETVGRFPNYSDENCSGYFLCSRTKNGTFLKTPYTCPTLSYFDPTISRCSQVYQCHEITTVASTSDFRTTTDHTNESHQTGSITTENYTTDTADTTVEDANIVEIHSTDHQGIETENSTMEGGQITEGVTEAVKSTLGEMEGTIGVSESEETTSPTTITTVTIPDWTFSCNKIGRFKNEDDLHCKSYFLCSQFRNGTFVQTQYDCPNNSVFNDIKHMCSDVISCVH